MKHPLSPCTRNIIDCFADSPVWGTLLPTLERLSKVQLDLSASLPDALKRKATVASFSDENLCIAVTSSAVATKLRQTLPRIESGLKGRGWKVNAIQIRVQPDVNLYESKGYPISQKRAVVSSQGRQSLASLGDTLEAGPLKAALTRLAGR